MLLLTPHKHQTLLDDIINTVNELVFRAVNAIEEGLSQAPPAQLGFNVPANAAHDDDALLELKQNEVDNGIVQLESLLNSTVDKDFDKFEIYTLRNILAVGHGEEAADLASWVRLEHYKHLDLASQNGDGSRGVVVTPEEVQLQRRKLHETAKLNAMLKAEEARNTTVLSQLAALTQSSADTSEGGEAAPFAFLAPASTSGNSGSLAQPLAQNTHYAIAQLPALRDLVAQLKESLQTLPDARNRASGDEDESREGQRRRYLDVQARRAVQRKGIDPTAAATAASSVGRKAGRDEVEGMEAVVRGLQGR